MLQFKSYPYQCGYHYYKRLYPLNAPVLLDSNRRGDVDIVAASPRLILEKRGNETIFTDLSQGTKQSCQAPLHELMAKLSPDVVDCDRLPFVGGWIGFFSYDYGRELEQIPQKIPNDTSIPDAWFAYYDWAMVSCHKSKTSWLVYDDRDQESQIFKRFCYHLENNPSASLKRFYLESEFTSSLSEAEYHRRFETIARYIRDGHIYQTNFSQRFQASFRGDPLDAYDKLRLKNPAPFGAFLRYGPKAWLASSSPERFLKVRDKQVETKPIKGTAPRDSNPIKDAQNLKRLEDSEKDKAENLMIVDLLRNDLSKHCLPGSVRVPKLFEPVSFKNVHHLVSTVTGTLADDRHPLDLLVGAFPGGSVTGCPKIRAMQISEEIEPVRRAVFCGSICYYSVNGQMDSNIVIRTCAFDNTQVYLWAGGGIVYDSTASGEYQETFDKVNIIMDILRKHSHDATMEAS